MHGVVCAGCIEFEEVVVSSAAAEEAKPVPAAGIKREGNASQWSGKQSRRTTSLLNLFMPNSQGTSSHVLLVTHILPNSSSFYPIFVSIHLHIAAVVCLCLFIPVFVYTPAQRMLSMFIESCEECLIVVCTIYIF